MSGLGPPALTGFLLGNGGSFPPGAQEKEGAGQPEQGRLLGHAPLWTPPVRPDEVRGTEVRGPLCLRLGDQLLSTTIFFDDIKYEDALKILQYSEPYKVQFTVRRQLPAREDEEGASGGAPRGSRGSKKQVRLHGRVPRLRLGGDPHCPLPSPEPLPSTPCTAAQKVLSPCFRTRISPKGARRPPRRRCRRMETRRGSSPSPGRAEAGSPRGSGSPGPNSKL